LSGYWLDRRGWHEPFIIGILICAGGTLISGWSTTPEIYIISRGIAGLGYGFTWMSAQGYIISDPDAKDRASALSSLIAGIFIGFICGNAVGAMLADRIGFAAVFQISAIFIVMPLVFIIIFMRRHYRKQAVVIDRDAPITFHELFSFLKNRQVVATMFFSVFPQSLCQLGLIQFAVPVYLFSIGISQANIGRAIMIYGLIFVFIAPIVSRYLDRTQNHKLFIVLGGFIGGAGLAQFYFYSGYISILVAIMLMGLAACFMISAQSIFILEPAQSSNISPGVAVSIQRTVTKLGQMMGPLIFSALLVTYQMEKGMMIMGIYFALATVVFLLLTIRRTDTIN
jgi:predicted MFS family arabinose efflux permease